MALDLLGEGALARAWSRWWCSAPIVMVVGVAGALAQGGFYLATKAVKPSSSKLNPIKGAKRIFGPQALWEGAKMLVKSAVVGAPRLDARSAALMPLLGGLVPIPVVLEQLADERRSA